MFKLFRHEVQEELDKHPPLHQGVFTEADLAPLPEPVQRYFRTCGWIGKPKMSNAAIHITGMLLKMNLDKEFLPVKSYQFNSVAEPVRIAYLKSALFGFIPFSGRDKYQDEGNMHIKVMNLIPVVNLKGTEMNKGALVTLLAETFLVPTYALQPYVKWQTLDGNTAAATLSHNNTSVSGIFHFNSRGEFESFETTDRYMTQKDGSLKQTRWIATLKNYQWINGVRIATEMSASWGTETGLKQYAKMKIDDVRYDIQHVDEVLFKK